MRTAKTLIRLGECWAHMPFCWFCHEVAQILGSKMKVFIMLFKFSDRQIWANSVDPDHTAPRLKEQSDQGLHCLPFCLHLLDR